jgi:glutathione S-transferase
MKYGTLPKLYLPNGTIMHQSIAITRYMGRVFKGSKGEELYPADPMNRFWIDIALEKSGALVNELALGFASSLGPGYKKYRENADKFLAIGGPFEKHLIVMEFLMESTGNKGYLTSDHIQLADLAYFGHFYKIGLNPVLKNGKKAHVCESVKVIVDLHPKIRKWFDMML